MLVKLYSCATLLHVAQQMDKIDYIELLTYNFMKQSIKNAKDSKEHFLFDYEPLLIQYFPATKDIFTAIKHKKFDVALEHIDKLLVNVGVVGDSDEQ